MQNSTPFWGLFGKNTIALRRLHGVFRRAERSESAAESRDSRKPTVRSAGSGVLAHSIVAAAESASVTIAAASDQSTADIRRQFHRLGEWLIASVDADAGATAEPPVMPADYVVAFRTHLLKELSAPELPDTRHVIRTLVNLDLAAEAWKRTDRGRFILRLTGSRSVDAVVAIAHDIRSPLCSILLLVDALRRSQAQGLDPVRDKYLGLIYGAALGLSTTVDNLILAVRGAGLTHGHPLPFSVTETLMSVSAIVQPMCEEKGLSLEIQCPAMDSRVGHASVIHQALLNLASNAIRHTDSGSVTLGCTELSGNTAEFWVEDTGPGIPDDVLERFCYGFPPEEVAQRFSGTGLGLAIVRALVEAMGSTLQVDTGSEGTRFCFLLDIPASAEDANRGLAASAPSNTEQASALHLTPA